jgi:4a-hydroxytetrahydrobiopterin dehydratase
MQDETSCALGAKKCVPCEGGVPRLREEEASRLLREVPKWALHHEMLERPASIHREWTFKDFAEALAFVNRVGAVAEAENHHPDILIFEWRKVRLTLTTHAIKGLSENDFILAAKIDALGPEAA